jgi:hypothetical protein
LGFKISHFDCNAIGQIEIIEDKCKFTNINLFPKVYIKEERWRDKAKAAMEKTHKHCLIANSVNAAIFYHTQIVVDRHPANAIEGTNGLLYGIEKNEG